MSKQIKWILTQRINSLKYSFIFGCLEIFIKKIWILVNMSIYRNGGKWKSNYDQIGGWLQLQFIEMLFVY